MKREDILKHPRNKHIRYDEAAHRYYYSPSGRWTDTKQFQGITKWIGQYYEAFDANKMARSCSKNPRSEYYGIDPEEIKAIWKSDTSFGTEVHKAIEDLVNTGEITQKYEGYLDDVLDILDDKNLEPLICEWVVYDEELQKASPIDLVCANEDGELVIIDVKTYKKGLKFTAYGNKTFNYPFQHVPDTNYDKVSFQTSIYHTFSQKYEGLKLADERYVLVVNEEGVSLVPCFDYSDEIQQMRKWELND